MEYRIRSISKRSSHSLILLIADCEVMLSSRWHQSDHLGILQQHNEINSRKLRSQVLPDHRRYCPPRPISDSATHLRYNIRRHSWSRISIDVVANACRMCIHHRLQITDVAVFFRSWKRRIGWNDRFPDDLNNNSIRRGKAQERRVGGMLIGILLSAYLRPYTDCASNKTSLFLFMA